MGQLPVFHDGERGAGALHLAGGGGEQAAGLGEVHAEDGGDRGGGELVAHGQLQGLPLLGGRAGGFGPGQLGLSRWRRCSVSSGARAVASEARGAVFVAWEAPVPRAACAPWRSRLASARRRKQTQRARA